MTPLDIRYALARAGCTSQQLAEANGVGRRNINYVISGTLKTPRLRAAIAAAGGFRVEDAWPGDEQHGLPPER